MPGAGGSGGPAAPGAKMQAKQALGMAMLLGTAVIWVVSSFISNALVSDHDDQKAAVPPFLLTFLATCMFTLYLPALQAKQWLTDHWPATKKTARHTRLPISEDAADSSSDKAIRRGGDAAARDASYRAAITAALWCAPLWFCAQLTFNMSLAFTSVTSNTILSSTSSLFTYGFSIMLLGELYTHRKLACILATIGGTALVTLSDSRAEAAITAFPPPPFDGSTPPAGPGAGSRGHGSVFGDALVLVSGMLYGMYTVVMRRHMPRAEEEASAVARFFGFVGLFTVVAVGPVVAALSSMSVISLSAIPRSAYGLIVLEGLLDYVLADYLWARSVMLLGPTVATLGLSVQIPMAAVAELMVGHPAWVKRASWIAMTLGGTGLILLGFVGVNMSSAGGKGGGSGGGASGSSSGGGSGTALAAWDDPVAKDSGSEGEPATASSDRVALLGGGLGGGLGDAAEVAPPGHAGEVTRLLVPTQRHGHGADRRDEPREVGSSSGVWAWIIRATGTAAGGARGHAGGGAGWAREGGNGTAGDMLPPTSAAGRPSLGSLSLERTSVDNASDGHVAGPWARG